MTNWEQIYSSNSSYRSNYPWDFIVSVIYKECSNLNRKLRILELGCGCGNNLIPLQHLFEEAVGIDMSETAIKYASDWADNVDAHHINFISSPLELFSFKSLGTFDIIFDRACLSLLNPDFVVQIVNTLSASNMHNKSMLFLNLYSDLNSSLAPEMVNQSSFANVGDVRAPQAFYYSRIHMLNFQSIDLKLESLKLMSLTDYHEHLLTQHSEWRAIFRKYGH